MIDYSSYPFLASPTPWARQSTLAFVRHSRPSGAGFGRSCRGNTKVCAVTSDGVWPWRICQSAGRGLGFDGAVWALTREDASPTRDWTCVRLSARMPWCPLRLPSSAGARVDPTSDVGAEGRIANAIVDSLVALSGPCSSHALIPSLPQRIIGMDMRWLRTWAMVD